MTRTEKRDFRKWERQCGHGLGDRLLDWITRVSPGLEDVGVMFGGMMIPPGGEQGGTDG